MTLHKKQEAICLQLGDQADLSSCYCGQALILQAWGRLEEAIALHQKEEDICLQLGHWAGLARSWANQANIAHQTGDRARAIDLTRRALAIFEQHRMPAETKIARDNLTLFQSESASA